jgi:hypothetical protein
VAVAAYDTLGNVGKLSSVACGTTEEVTDFFENYRQAGGKAGNGCGCRIAGARESREGALAFVLCALAVGLRRQRGAR